MNGIRQRLSVGKSVQFTEKEAEDVQKMADQLNTSFAEIVRVCQSRAAKDERTHPQTDRVRNKKR